MLPATVEKRTNTGVRLAGRWNRSARVSRSSGLVRLEEAVRAEPAGVHHALGNALVIEVEDLLAEVEILEQRRAALADLQGVLIVGDRNALLRRQPDPTVLHGLMRLATLADVDRRTLAVRRRG